MISAPSRFFGFVPRLLPVILVLLFPAWAAAQQTLYWDGNGATSGAGTAPSGTWGSSAFWSTSSAGTSATANTLTTALDTLVFSAGTTATGSYGITVSGTQNARTLSIEEGTVTFTGGTIALGAGGGITVGTTAGVGQTLSSNLSISGAQIFNIGSGRTLALDTGTFTRGAGAVLNVQGSGTLTSTMTGLSTNNAAGIVGAWASIGAGTATRYATFSGSTLMPLTGTAAANAAALTDTTGLVNYDLAAATGTMPATVSANTIRYTGIASITNLGADAFSVNGLMNANTGAWTIQSNTLTIGAAKELVVNTANQAIIIHSAIQDNGGGASSLTKTGLGNNGGMVLSLGGVNTYTGGTHVSAGVLTFLNTSAKPAVGAVTVPAGTTLGLGVATSGAYFTSANVDSLFAGTLPGVTNDATSNVGIDTTAGHFTYASDIAPTTRGLTKLGANNLTVTGTSSYTGPTTIIGANSKLSVDTINNGGVPGSLGASSNAAANLVLILGGTLQYTGASASTDRNFTLGTDSFGNIEITNPATNLTFTGGTAATNGTLNKLGPGTLTLAGNNLHTGFATVNSGTLVLDFTASDTSKLANTLTIRNATVQIDRATGASGSHVEVVNSTTISGGARIIRGAGSTAILRMNGIGRVAGYTLDFGAAGIADTDTTNTNGLLGNGHGWATIGGTDWAMNSTNGPDGSITAYTAYTSVTRQSSGTKVIANNSASNVRIVEGSGGAPASLTLGAATTTINTLNQSASGGTGAAAIDTAGQTLAVHGILVGTGAGALTIGTADANRGTLQPATAGGEVILQNFGSNGLTIHSNITNNTSSSPLTHAGTGTTVLTGPNSTYTGSTNIVGGALEVSGGGKITATSSVILDGGALTINGATASSVASTGTVFVGQYSSGTLTINGGGTLSGSSGNVATNSGSSGSVTVSGAGSTWTNSSVLNMGNSGTGTLVINNGGAVSNTNGFLGNSAGGMGSATVSGAGSTWTNSGLFYVGYSGVGTLDIDSGGVVTNNSSGTLGHFVGSVGSATVSGAGSAWTSSSNLIVGNLGKGTLVIENGGQVSNNIGFIGNSAGGTGSVTVSGAGSTWNNTTQISVGASGTGSLTINNAGTVTNSGNSLIGVIAGSVGSATVSGTGSTWTNGGSLTVGNSGNGTLVIENGGVVSNGIGLISTGAGTTGMVTVSGTGSTWNTNTQLTVGGSGTGTLSIANGGTVTNTGFSIIGSSAGSAGTATVSGAGSSWTNSGNLTVGSSGTGTLNISAGGLVSAARLDGGNASSSVNLDGGTLRITTTDSASNIINLLAGGGTFDIPTASTNFTINSAISGAGALSKTGQATLTLSGANTHSGGTMVSDGTLNLTNTTGSATGTGDVTINSGSTLAGTGRAEAGVNKSIILNGTLSVGNSTLISPVASQLELVTSGTGSTILGPGGSLQFDLFSGAGLGDNTAIAAAADRIKLFGAFDTTLGGQIVLGNPSLMSGFAAGDAWRLFDLSGGGSITSYLSVDFTSLMLGDGLVGAFDHETGVFSISIIPEPSRALLLLIGFGGLLLRRRRNRGGCGSAGRS